MLLKIFCVFITVPVTLPPLPHFSVSFTNLVLKFFLQWSAVNTKDCLKRTIYSLFQRQVKVLYVYLLQFTAGKIHTYHICYYNGHSSLLILPSETRTQSLCTFALKIKQSITHYLQVRDCSRMACVAIREENTLSERYLLSHYQRKSSE